MTRSWWRRRAFGLSIVMLVAVLVPAGSRAAAPTLAPDGYVGADGHGYGHGRGLGQWGAKGMADKGSSWTDILALYYQNTTLGSRGSETIRVLVEDSADVVVTSRASFSVWWAGGAKIADSSDEMPFLRAVISGSQVAVQRSAGANGPWTTVATGSGPAQFRPGAQTLGLVAGSVRYYRGVIEARLPGGSSSLLAINDVGMDAYLYGVVPREMPASWDQDALRAQAVAARSYAANKKDAARSASKLYDICATTACQVYGGYASASSPTENPTVLENAATNAAVDATAGKVLLNSGKAILAEYSSSTGGYTAPGSQPYQKAVADPGDDVSPYHNWSTRISVASIQTGWPELGSLTGVRITKRNGYGADGGRVTEMVLDGTDASVTMSGNTFRSKMGLRSDWFTIRTYAAQLINASAQVSGPVGADIPVAVYLKNVGNQEWRVAGNERLAIPSGRDSPFAGPEWLTPTKPARVTKNVPRPSATTIGPGEVAEFRFVLHTDGVVPGVYIESFRPLVEGLTWMNDVGITMTVTVLSSWAERTGNMATNGSFEYGWSAWQGYGVNRGDGPASGTTRDGKTSMHLAAGGRKGIVQSLSMVGGPGRRVVISGWARTIGTNPRGGSVLINLALKNADGSTSWNPIEFSRSEHDWQYVERVVQAPKVFTSAALYGVFYDQTGHVYFDAFRVSDTSLANPSFELGTGWWNEVGLVPGDGPSTATFVDGFRSMHFAGGIKSLTQRVPVSGPAARMFRIGGWTKAEGANSTGFTAITVVFNNTDGSQSTYTTQAPAGNHEWDYSENHVTATKNFGSIDVMVSVSGQTGSVFFDGIALREQRIPNGSFDAGLDGWETTDSYSASADGVVSSPVRDGPGAVRFTAPGRKGVRIHLESGGSPGAAILLSAWNRTAAAHADRAVKLVLAFRNRDGSTSWRNSFFPAPAHDWVHQEILVRADKSYRTIDVYVMVENVTGDVVFDGVTLWALY